MAHQTNRRAGVLAVLSNSQDNSNHAFDTKKSGPKTKGALPHWLSIEMGGVESENFLVLLKRVRANPWARSLFLSPRFAPTYLRRRLRLVRASVRALGFRSPPKTSVLLRAVGERGLLCPTDTAIWLIDRVEGLGGLCFVLSEPVPNTGGVPSLFAIDATGARPTLVGAAARENERWCLDNEVVFNVP